MKRLYSAVMALYSQWYSRPGKDAGKKFATRNLQEALLPINLIFTKGCRASREVTTGIGGKPGPAGLKRMVIGKTADRRSFRRRSREMVDPCSRQIPTISSGRDSA
jgi:hypothetical protein